MNRLPTDKHGAVFQAIDPGTVHNITLSGTSAASAAFQKQTRVVRIAATHACWVAFGEDPTADDVSGFLVPAGKVEHFGVQGGHKVAAVEAVAASGGALSVVEAA